MLKLPERYSSLADDDDEKNYIRTQVESSIVLWVYENDSKSISPILHEILHSGQGRTRRDTVDFAGNTWDGDITPLRQCLTRVAWYVGSSTQ